MNFRLLQAEKAVAVASKRNFLRHKMNTVIEDGGANPVAFAHMDGAWLGPVIFT